MNEVPNPDLHTVAASWVPIDEIASLPLTSLAHRGAALARARVS